MRYHLLILLLTPLLILNTAPQPTSAWGYSVHGEIAAQAIELLPEPWNNYFRDYAEDLREASVFADQRKGSDPREPGRHYDDQDEPHQDRYVPFPSTNWSLGVVSWAIENTTRDLTIAFADNNTADIMLYMGDAAHYIADAAQPLHATKNYDGQYTGNRGIHSRFETRVVSRNFDDAFDLSNFNATQLIDDAYLMGEEQITTGLALVPAVLEADDVATGIDEDYGDAYYESLYEQTRDMIRDRLALAIQNTANIWYTALYNAGWIEEETSSTTMQSVETSQSETSTALSSSTSDTSQSGILSDTAPSPLMPMLVLIPIIVSLRKRASR
ncbi:MAG: zinc dependent phospholipase C family protein [Candidatus Kariarchaeaceae archaeon]